MMNRNIHRPNRTLYMFLNRTGLDVANKGLNLRFWVRESTQTIDVLCTSD